MECLGSLKIVVNKCYGGFGLSDLAIDLYKRLKGIDDKEYLSVYSMDRTDPIFIKVIEQLGDKANSDYSNLVINEIDNPPYALIYYELMEYDGFEWIIYSNAEIKEVE